MPAGKCARTVDQIQDEAGLACVDVVKMDIEGSEFGLFKHPGLLDRVRAIVMAVHSRSGRPESLGKVGEWRRFGGDEGRRPAVCNEGVGCLLYRSLEVRPGWALL